jgi:hypothetical protein
VHSASVEQAASELNPQLPLLQAKGVAQSSEVTQMAVQDVPSDAQR